MMQNENTGNKPDTQKNPRVRNKKCTNEQKNFKIRQVLMEKYEQLQKTRDLTIVEARKYDQIKADLFNELVRFAKLIASQQAGKYRLPNDAYDDIMQEIAVVFYEHLKDYDPLCSTPSTFFVTHFRGAISKYVRSDSQHLTQNDANNLGIVRRCVAYFEAQGVKWDETMIVERTKMYTPDGLSMKVVKNTLKLASTSMYVDIDDNLNVGSKQPSPEDQFIKNEFLENIDKAISDTLSESDKLFFYTKLNLDGDKMRTHKEMSEMYKESLHTIRTRWAGIISKLANNKVIQSYYHPHDNIDAVVSLQPDTEVDLEEEMLNMLSEFNKDLDNVSHN